jgi:hypothetical protein
MRLSGPGRRGPTAPAFRGQPRFFANTDQILCWEHSRAIQFSPAAMLRVARAAALRRWASPQSQKVGTP